MNEAKLFAFLATIVLNCSFVLCTFTTSSFLGKEVKTDKEPASEEEKMMLLKALSHVQMDETDVLLGDKKQEKSLVDDSVEKEGYDIKSKYKTVKKPINKNGTEVNKKTFDPKELVKTLGNQPSSDTLKSVLNLIKEHNVSIYSTNFDYIVYYNSVKGMKSEKCYILMALLIKLIFHT